MATHIEGHARLLRRNVQFEHIQQAHNARAEALNHFERTEEVHMRQEYGSIKTNIGPPSFDLELYHIRSQNVRRNRPVVTARSSLHSMARC